MDLNNKISFSKGKVVKPVIEEQQKEIDRIKEYFDGDITTPDNMEYDDAAEFIKDKNKLIEDLENLDPDDYDVPF